MLWNALRCGFFAMAVALAACDGGSDGDTGEGGEGGDPVTGGGGAGGSTGGNSTGGSTGGSSTGGSSTGGSTGGSSTGGSGTGGGAGLSCAELQDCYAGCMDDACIVQCYESGTAEAKAQDDAMYTCFAQQGCIVNNQVDADCAYAKCGGEIAACVGGAPSCDPPCPAGSSCENGQCTPVAQGPACDPMYATLTVDTLIACVEAKSAIDGKCNVGAGVWDGIACCSRMSSCALELYEAPCSVCLVSAAVSAVTCSYGGFDVSACFE